MIPHVVTVMTSECAFRFSPEGAEVAFVFLRLLRGDISIDQFVAAVAALTQLPVERIVQDFIHACNLASY